MWPGNEAILEHVTKENDLPVYVLYSVMSRAPVVLWLGYHLVSHLGHICLPAAQQSFGKVVEWASGCSPVALTGVQLSLVHLWLLY